MGCAASAPCSSSAMPLPGVGQSIHTFMQSLRPWDEDIINTTTTTTTKEPTEDKIYYYTKQQQRRLACPTAWAGGCCVRRGKKDRQYHYTTPHGALLIKRLSDRTGCDSRRMKTSSCDKTAVIANVDWKTPGNNDEDGRGAMDGSPTTRSRRNHLIPPFVSTEASLTVQVIREGPTMVWDDESPLTRSNTTTARAGYYYPHHHHHHQSYPSTNNYLLRTPGTTLVSVTPNTEEREMYIAARGQRMELLRKSLTSLNEVHSNYCDGFEGGTYLGSTYYWSPEYNSTNNNNNNNEMMFMTPIESASPLMEYTTPIDDCNANATQKKTTVVSVKDHLARLGLALFNDNDDDDEMYNNTPTSSCSTSASENTPIDDNIEDNDGCDLLPRQHHAAGSMLLDISSDLLDYSLVTDENNNGYDFLSYQHHVVASLLDISSDLLDLSLVTTTGEQSSYQMPRRLFDDDHSNDGCNHEYQNAMSNRVPKLPPSPKDTPPMRRRQRLHSGGANKPLSTTTSNDSIISSLSFLRNSPHVSPLNVTSGGLDDDDHDTAKIMIEQRISTLPSLAHNHPIRLLFIEEKSSKIAVVSNNSSSATPKTPATPEDEYYFSYDPHFPLMSEYNITNYHDGKSYGNGLVLKMGGYDGRRRRKNINNTNGAQSSSQFPSQSDGFASASQFMILEDRIGNVPCVIMSLRTHIPCMILYSPKPRYVGQKPSGHRLLSPHTENKGMSSNEAAATTTTIIDDTAGERDDIDDNSVALFPCALIGKNGRTREDECMIHLVKINGGAMKDNTAEQSSPLTSNGIFHSYPSFRGRHGFDERGMHTHTVVHRITSPNTEKIPNTLSSNSENNVILEGGVPCCLMIRDPSNVDSVDLTIAPGIDPILMICYLACHTQMDVECIMTGF